MSFPCPYCDHRIVIKNPKPGRYRPKCPNCSNILVLTVPAGAASVPIAERVANPPAEANDDATQVIMEFAGQQESSDDDATLMIAAFGEKPNRRADEDPTEVAEAPDTGSREAISVRPTKAARTPIGRKRRRSDYDFTLKPPEGVPAIIGGYRLIQELGRGGMGAVYLAQQVSLDRPVALKVMNPTWSSDAAFVARFTREAYAAAQLAHHNIVQIYDFGEDRGLHYFSMEFVDGKTLADIVKHEGKLEPEEAVGYVLQAARGLQLAHDRGMIHRDIKPDNLMLNSQGVVKVADLGLIKTPGMQEPAPAQEEGSKLAESAATAVTKAGFAIGTPAYMSPEQARDAAKVDHRADIYSLGCTLYVLVTGKPPFEGRTALELFTKHATEPLVPPDALVKSVPKELSALIEKMVAKKPEDRFADMGAVAGALEEWLGIKGEAASGNIKEEHAVQLEDAVRQFNNVPMAGMRGLLKFAIFGGSILLAILFLLLGWWKLGLGALLLSVESMVAYFLVSAFQRPDALTVKIRELLIESRWKERIQAAIAILLVLAILFVAGLFWHWLAFTILAVAAAIGLHFGINRSVESSRLPAIDAAEELFRNLRLRGLDEVALRQFACKYGGNQWEEFFETLFGFDEKLKARDWWIREQKGQSRPKFAAWREPLIRWLDAKLSARRAARNQAVLQQLEAKRLEAEGLNRGEAEAKAEHSAGVVVQQAAELRAETYMPVADEREHLRRRKRLAAILSAEPKEETPRKGRSASSWTAKFINTFFGPNLRFLLGALLVAAGLYWIYQNMLYVDLQNVRTLDDLKPIALGRHKDQATGVFVEARPVHVAGYTLSFFDSFSPLVAGFLLIVSSLRSSLVTAVLMPFVAAFIVFGPMLGVPGAWNLSPSHLCLAIGSAVGLIALFLTRERY